jgi:hypothetical protein
MSPRCLNSWGLGCRGVADHDHDDRCTQNDVEGEGAHPGEDESVSEDGEHQGTEEGADNGARSAGEQGPADHRRRHRNEHTLSDNSGAGIERPDPDSLDHACEPGEHRRHHEVAHPDPRRRHTGLSGTGRVPPDGGRVFERDRALRAQRP